MATVMWQVVSNGRPMGTFDEPYLVQLAAAGRVHPNDLFWRHGMAAAAPAYTLAPFDRYFGAPRLGDDAAMRWLLPVGRSPWAIAAGYLGLFSFLLVFGPLAIGAGVLGLRQIKANPRMHGKGRSIFGIVAGALGTALLALVIAAQ